MQMVFDKYLGDGKPGNVPTHWAALDQAVDWIVGAGGRAAIAHPGRYDYTPLQFDALFERFKELGGTAIEVVTGSHTPDQYREYADVARRYGFLASCGSDFHRPKEGKLDRSEEHTSELQPPMRSAYADSCLKKKEQQTTLQSLKRQPQ